MDDQDRIRQAIEGDSRASKVWKELSKSGIDVGYLLAALPIYVEHTRKRRTGAASLEVVNVDAHGRWRRITASAYKLKTLPTRLRELADDLAIAGSLVPMPENLIDTSKLRELAAWLEKNRSVIPDARLLHGPTRWLKLIMLNAVPPGQNTDLQKLARQLAEVLAPIGNLFDFDPPSRDAILKLAKRTLPRRT